MQLKFTKMHGAGNDFIVIDAVSQQVDLSPEQWARLAAAEAAVDTIRGKFGNDSVELGLVFNRPPRPRR